LRRGLADLGAEGGFKKKNRPFGCSLRLFGLEKRGRGKRESLYFFEGRCRGYTGKGKDRLNMNGHQSHGQNLNRKNGIAEKVNGGMWVWAGSRLRRKQGSMNKGSGRKTEKMKAQMPITEREGERRLLRKVVNAGSRGGSKPREATTQQSGEQVVNRERSDEDKHWPS